jgi:hypothetical protein
VEYALIQSASLAAVKTVLGDSSFDVLWKHQWEAGNLPASSYVRLSMIQDRIVGRPYIRFEASGSGQDAVLIEKEWQDRQVIIQYDVSTLNQSLENSAIAIASKIRGGYNLTPVQEIFRRSGLSPANIGTYIDNSEVGDRQRVNSQGSFEVVFNATEVTRIEAHSIGPIGAVEISGTLTNGKTYHIDSWITSSFFFQHNIVLFDEGFVPFHNTDETSHAFTFGFPSAPDAVVISLYEDIDNSGGVFLQGIEYNTASFSVAASAPFSGSVRYRAIWSSNLPKYPTFVTSTLEPISGVLIATAGKSHTQNLFGTPKTNWILDYQNLPVDPTDYDITHWAYGKQTGIPIINIDNVNFDAISGSIAAPFDKYNAGLFHSIAVISGVL